MSTARRLHYTYAEYLALLASHDLKLEYYDGTIYAMAGGSREHAALSVAMSSILRGLLRDCLVLSSDAKVHVEATGLSTFPDCSVVCGKPLDAKIDAHATTNPTILVEVLSPSTEDYDRGDKLSQYKQIESLRAVLLVSYKSKCITVVERSESGWSERDVRAGETLSLERPSLSFAVDDVYDGIVLASPEPRA
jgi:Uma2 family endonuclease